MNVVWDVCGVSAYVYDMCVCDVCRVCEVCEVEGWGCVCVGVCRMCVACEVEVWCVGVSSAHISVLFSSVSSWPCLAEV